MPRPSRNIPENLTGPAGSSWWKSGYFGPQYLALYTEQLLPPATTESEARFVVSALELDAEQPVLDVPCGYGRHLDALAEAGLRVFAAELQLPFLQYYMNNRNGGGLPSVLAADMARLPFLDRCFGGLLNMFNSFGYFSDDSENNADGRTNRSVLTEFARVLAPGGKILIDLPDRDALTLAIEATPRTRVGGADWEIMEEWHFDLDSKRIHNRTRFRVADHSIDTGYDMRLYSRSEIESEFRAVGLEPWRFWGELDLEMKDEPGERLVVAGIKV